MNYQPPFSLEGLGEGRGGGRGEGGGEGRWEGGRGREGEGRRGGGEGGEEGGEHRCRQVEESECEADLPQRRRGRRGQGRRVLTGNG